jgi:hypothetical protein
MNPLKVGDIVRRVGGSLIPDEYGRKGYIATVLAIRYNYIKVTLPAGDFWSCCGRWEYVTHEPTPQEIEEMIG